VTAMTTVAMVGNGREFKNGRRFSAWLGMVPRQYSTGGKTRLGPITRRGDVYLRSLFIQCAKALSAVAHRRKRSAEPLGADGSGSPRLWESGRGRCCEACAHRLGDSCQGRAVSPRAAAEHGERVGRLPGS